MKRLLGSNARQLGTFAVLIVLGTVITILTPFVLRKQGVPVGGIAEVVAIAIIPSVWYWAGRLRIAVAPVGCCKRAAMVKGKERDGMGVTLAGKR